MKKVAIVGAGISGLFIANLFKTNSNYEIIIFEKNSMINLDEGYGIQLSVNSVKHLNKIGFNKLEDNQKFNPKKLDFYFKNKNKKICDLEISKFNSENCRYTTLKRSVLINFLKKDLENFIKTGRNISKIDHQDQKISITFENHENIECDYLIISDGVFSKSKSLISNNLVKPKYNQSLAIRGILNDITNDIERNNISLFLNSNFHHVIYPVNSGKDFNFIAIMKYDLSFEEQNNSSLLNQESFIQRVLKKIPPDAKETIKNLKSLKIFPVFVSEDFYRSQNENIHLIGDAFFAFPPSFAQGASQSIEGAYELFKNIENNTERDFLNFRIHRTKMINNRSKFNQFVFHLSNPITIFFRNFFLKRLVKNKKFLYTYLGNIYK